VRLGQRTTTYDAEGYIIGGTTDNIPSRDKINAAREFQRGTIQQVPPIYSAIKQGGEPLYVKARRGETVELAPREVTIHHLEILDWSPPDLTIDVLCSKGTYIRSIAHDLGEALGVGGHLVALRRTASGIFTQAQAHGLDDIQAATPETLAEWLLPIGTGLEKLPVLHVTTEEITALRQGKVLAAQQGSGTARALDENQWLIAIVRWRLDKGGWKPEKVFRIP
jgi:tRNA pseudouridine55 synthase